MCFLRFLCTYRLQWYPFDLQNCQLIFRMQGKSGDFAELGKLGYLILNLECIEYKISLELCSYALCFLLYYRGNDTEFSGRKGAK